MKRVARLGVELARSGIRCMRGRHHPAPLAGMTLDEDDAEIAKKWLKNRDQWNDGAVVAAFENAFAEWNGSRYVFAFSAGRKALSACLYALGLLPGDEVIIPGYTCIVVQNAFDFAGVATLYCDIELDTYGPKLESVAERITPRTKAILIQHLYGLVCRDYEAILKLARQNNLKVIEDCAQSTGATFHGKRVGTYGDLAFYSSEWSKSFTSVVGGVAVTNNRELANRFSEFAAQCVWPHASVIERQLHTAIRAFCRAKRPKNWWAIPWARFKYGVEETIGMSQSEVAGVKPADYFTRMPPSAAALALNQLRKINAYNERRRETAKIWDAWCDKNGYRKPMILADSTPVFLRYPVLVESAKKADTSWARQELGINLGVWFRTNLHPSPRIVENCPNADKAVAGCINFPCLLH